MRAEYFSLRTRERAIKYECIECRGLFYEAEGVLNVNGRTFICVECDVRMRKDLVPELTLERSIIL